MSKKWNLDQLERELTNHKEILFWSLNQETFHRRERYFMCPVNDKDGVIVADQDREVRGQNIYVRIAVKLLTNGRIGETFKRFFQSIPIANQIQDALDLAKETNLEAWELSKEVPSQIPNRLSADPSIAEDINHAINQATRLIINQAKKKRAARFNSSELFISVHEHEMRLSTGLKHRYSNTKAYVEAAFSKTEGAKSDEFLDRRWAVALDDLEINTLFEETAHRAEKMLDVVMPTSGRVAVLIDSEVMTSIVDGYVSQLSGVNAYNGLPFKPVGEDLIPGASGDLISLSLDPELPLSAGTTNVMSDGVIQNRVELVKANKVVSASIDKRHSDYLKRAPTTSHGTIVVAPGGATYQELLKKEPQVLEILQFSALFPDPNSGTFSSEIRLARLHDNKTGKVTYIKGGSLSVSIFENFKRARFSSNSVKRSDFNHSSTGHSYYGPEFALLNDVSVVG